MKIGLRRRPAPTGLFATERPPRLVLRFAVVLSLTLGLASAAILVAVHHFALSEAERSASRQASLVASALLQREVRPGDLGKPVSASRRRELDVLFRDHLLAADTLAVSLVGRNGLVTYSTDHRLIGARLSAALAAEAADGTIVSRTSTNRVPGAGAGTKTLETYAPVGPALHGGAAVIVQSYAPIAAAARALQVRIGAVLEALLLVLLAICIPLLVRVTRRIKKQVDRIHYQAFYDDLTGLPNRAHLFERLTLAVRRAQEDGRQLAVLVLDLDRFREINETLGHDAGDTVLVETAARLRKAAGAERIVARLGGDEFAVVTEHRLEDDVETLAQELRAAVEPPLSVRDLQVALEGTVGIAFFAKDGSDAETLLKHAEVAVHTAKQWRVAGLSYSPAVDPHDPEQLGLVAELRDAARKGELRLHYQPKVDLASGAVVGFEALAYWQHPTRGLLPPGAFVPIAERTGAIRHISRAVLAGAIKQLREWDTVDPNSTVSVNLTAIDLLDVQLPRRLRTLLKRNKVEPRRLCVELTESTVMADPERAQAVLERIAATGVRISIDDFGTGHSSLAYLKSLPAHELKIDKSFISGLMVSRQDRMIVHATIHLAHSLGLQVVAEGVETQEVHNTLRTLGCNHGQGYLYSRPLPITSLRPPETLEAA